MAEKINSNSIYTPKTINELTSARFKNPEALLVGGSCELLSSTNSLVNYSALDGIATCYVPELKRIYHSERYFEAGSCVTVQQFLNQCALLYSSEVYNAIENIASSVIRERATIGGSLFSTDCRYSLSCILSVLGAICEIKSVSKTRANRMKVKTSWVPVEKLYESDGKLAYGKGEILTKIRIPSNPDCKQIFITLGRPKHEPDSSVIMGIQYSVGSSLFANPTLCIVYPHGGFVCSSDINSVIAGLTLPCSYTNIVKTSNIILDSVLEMCPNISETQILRTRRVLQILIHGVNNAYTEG